MTKVWVLTNGLNYGIAKLIGEAVHQEKIKRETSLLHNIYIQVSVFSHT